MNESFKKAKSEEISPHEIVSQKLRGTPIINNNQIKPSASWSFFSWFGCCSDYSKNHNVLINKKNTDDSSKTTARDLSHYVISDLGSFLDLNKMNSDKKGGSILSCRTTDESNHDFQGPLEELFLLGSGNEKIICKIERIMLQSNTVSLNRKSSVCGFKSCIKFTKQDKSPKSLQSKTSSSNEREAKNSLNLYGDIASELVARYIGGLFENMLVVDGFCGNGANAVQVNSFS